MDTNPVGAHFRWWLAQAAQEARGQATREDIASLSRSGIDKIRRFEAGRTLPQDLDQVIAAYAELAGVNDPREIYQRALDLWYAHGVRPAIGRDGRRELATGERFEEALAQPVRQPGRPAPARTASTTRKRTAGS